MKRSFGAAIATVCAAVFLHPAGASADGARMGKVTNEAAAEECGACHMAYQPGFLPQRTWRTIMQTLPDHFGEDASLDEATRKEIEDYLLANAADAGRQQPEATDGQPPATLRISEMPWFRHEHGARRRARAEADPAIGSISNCAACHRGAESGNFDDD